MIEEYCKNGDLSKLIELHAKKNIMFQEDDILKLIVQASRVMECAHADNTLHLDLKP